MIFQWESSSATAYLKQLMSDETIAKIKAVNPNFSYIDLLSIGNGAIRPAGESYRDSLAKGEYSYYGNKELDEFMKPTLGFCVFQEQIIEFLHKFCGFTMGEADVVRRQFSKKTGTEQSIPVIKEGGYLNGGTREIPGFIKTMKEKYGVEREESEKLIGNFLQVIIDASDYLFSKNHSDPYSWIGYICGYLRYHYPLEFITTALNIFEGKEEKSLSIIDYAKRQGIKISSIKFRHSIAKYSYDKETNQIFKGISSIKYMNAAIADEIYALRNNQYRNFIDLVYDLKNKTSANSRQITILIELDFFDEFGDANNLLAQYNLATTFCDKVQVKKSKLEELYIPEHIARAYASRETDKMFLNINMREFLVASSQFIKAPKRTLKDKIGAQITHLGYLDIMEDRYCGMAAVMEIDTKYSPKLKMYSLKNGTLIECKIEKKVFNKDKLKAGDIVKVIASRNKPKQRRTEDGEYEPIPGSSELWVTNYKKVENI